MGTLELLGKFGNSRKKMLEKKKFSKLERKSHLHFRKKNLTFLSRNFKMREKISLFLSQDVGKKPETIQKMLKN
jgi:hypothetical protein